VQGVSLSRVTLIEAQSPPEPTTPNLQMLDASKSWSATKRLISSDCTNKFKIVQCKFTTADACPFIFEN
jgi:hypothetical protein